ncbi:MAG: caspase family protein, partial [Actinomycetota bacterium]|nr:caspase family protein [Actinomycetota bacterium]
MVATLALSACGARTVPGTVPSAYVPVAVAMPAPSPVPASIAADLGPPVGYPGVWAVVIGIDDYPEGTPDLQGAVADAETMLRALDLAGVPLDHRYVLEGSAATGAAIADALRWL